MSTTSNIQFNNHWKLKLPPFTGMNEDFDMLVEELYLLDEHYMGLATQTLAGVKGIKYNIEDVEKLKESFKKFNSIEKNAYNECLSYINSLEGLLKSINKIE